MKRWVLIASLLLMMTPVPALAKDSAKLMVYPDDRELVFTSFAGEDEAVVDDLQLTATGGDVDRFGFVAHELRREGGDEEIPRRRVKLIGKRTLQDGQTMIFPVNVLGVVDEPGTYTGQAEIRPTNQANFEEKQIKLKLVAKARPDVALEPAAFALSTNLVTCKAWLAEADCLFARQFIPGHPFQDEYPVKLRNDTHAKVHILSIEPVVMDEVDHTPLTEEELGWPKELTLPENKISTLPLDFHRNAMFPGHYTGYVSLTLENGLEPLKVPVDINVRTGGVWATLFLLAGVVVGQIGRVIEEEAKSREEQASDPTTTTIQRRGFFEVLLPDVDPLGAFVKVLSIVVAVIVGLTVVYGGVQGATFGANGVSDYLAIGAWGFAADLSSRGLLRYLGR